MTGGAGFIGSHLVDRLVQLGWATRVLDDLSTGRQTNIHPEAEFIQGSVENLDLVKACARDAGAIFHLAAIASVQRSVADPRGTHNINVGGTSNVVEAAAMAGSKLIYSSSSAVYGDSQSLPLTEESPTEPISPYGFQKLGSEKLVSEAGGTSLRYFNVFGPRQLPDSDYSGVISIFLSRARRNLELTIFGDGSATRDFVFVSNVVNANILALEGSPGIYNIGSGTRSTVFELARKVISLTRSSSQLAFAPSRPGDILDSACSVTLATHVLGYLPSESLDEGLRLLIKATS